jgi:hypothetical protein
MTKIVFTLCMLLVAVGSNAQRNFVPNGSFEHVDDCQIVHSLSGIMEGWYDYLRGGSSDAFTTCSVPPGVPSNAAGYQVPDQGNNYVGIFTSYNSNNGILMSETICRVIRPLLINRPCEVSMSVSKARTSVNEPSTDGFGVFFFNQGPASIPGAYQPAYMVPQVSYSSYGPVSDTANWTRLVKTYTPDSAYDHMVISTFSTALNHRAYYYIDSVVITQALNVDIGEILDTALCVGQTITVPYMVLANVFAPGNVFTLQLSDAIGSFTNPVNLAAVTSVNSGQFTFSIPLNTPPGTGYRMRVRSSNIIDSSAVNFYNISIANNIPVFPVAASNSPVCTGGKIQLSATTTTTPAWWRWTGANGFTSTLADPAIYNVTLANAGDYIVESYNGCGSKKDTTTVVVNMTPAQINSPTALALCEKAVIALTSSNSSPGVTWLWTGPNGYSATQQNPAIPNATTGMAGKYYVTATLNGCITKDSTNVLIRTSPIVTASNDTAVCNGQPVSFGATSNMPGVIWSWTGPNNFTSSQQLPVIPVTTMSSTGDYVITITEPAYSCKDTDTVYVLIKPTPVGFSATATTPVCGGQPINLVGNTSSTGVTFTWSGPSYSSSLQSPTIVNSTTAMSGDYELIANLNGCILKDTVTVEVKPTPTVTASSNFNICEGMPINMLASSNEPAATFGWAGPLGFTANTAITVRSNSTVPMSGNYVVTAALNGCSSQYTLPVVVNPQPILPTVSSNSIACDTLKLFATGSIGASYYWNGPGGYTSNQQNPFIEPASPAHNGTYTVFSTLGPCVSAGVNVQASVHPRPYLGAYASPNDTVCDGTVVTFVTVPMNGIQNPQFQWFKNGVEVAGQTSLTYVGAYATGDKFYCRTYAQDLCNNNITLYSNEISMVVQPIVNSLSASISSVPAIPQPGQPINFKCDVVSGGYTPQFQWRKNGQDILGAIHANWSANNLAPYDEITCHVTSSDPCATPKETVAAKVIINFPTTVNDVNTDNGISIYPNPNSGNFTIESKTHKVTEVELLNSIGQKVYSLKADGKALNISLPASLANGIYTLKLNTEAGIHQQRITLQR